MAMRNKHKEKRSQENPEGEGRQRVRSAADQKGRTGRLRGWSDSEEGGEAKTKRKKRAVTTAVEHDLEEGGHFQLDATHLGQPGTYEEPAKVRRKRVVNAPKEKKKKGTSEKESKAEKLGQKVVKAAKERKDKKEKKRKKDHGEYPEAYGMMGPMLAPMMGMMRSMSYPMVPGMMMMPGGIIGAPFMGGPVGPMGMHGAPLAYSLPTAPMVPPMSKAKTKAEEKRRRFTEAPAEPEPVEEPEPLPPPEEAEKRSASVSSSSSSSTSEAKNEGGPAGPPEAVPPAREWGEGELELGLISPEPAEKEEHSPLQVPPGMESPEPSQSPGEASHGLTKPTTWVEVEGETMEELQRELEVSCQNKPCASVATQTDMEDLPTAEDLSEDLADRWFLGFVDAVVPAQGKEESSDSSDSSEAEEEATCRPERQLRRRSRSQSGPEASKPTGDANEDERCCSSSSSSSSSSGGSRRRQRAPSSDEEAAKATQSLAPQMPVDPRRLRMVQDYSDVA